MNPPIPKDAVFHLRCSILFLGIIFLMPNLGVPFTESWGNPGEQQPAKQPSVQFNKPILTVEPGTVPIGVLLEKIAAATGIRIILMGPADTPISTPRLSGKIEHVIGRMVPHIDVAFRYKSEKGPPRHTALTDAIIVMDRQKAIQTEFTGNGGIQDAMETAVSGTSENMDEDWIQSLENGDIEKFEDTLLQDEKPSHRRIAAQILGNISTDQLERVSDLLQKALNDEDPIVRLNAVEAMGMIGGEKAKIALSEALFDRHAEVRASSLKLLGTLRMVNSFDMVSQGLKDADARVRIASIEMISEMEDAESAGLLNLVKEDPDASVRNAAQQVSSQYNELDNQNAPAGK